MAHLLRMGWFCPVHLKSIDAREQQALLSARLTLTRRLRDIVNSARPAAALRIRSPTVNLQGSRRAVQKSKNCIKCEPDHSSERFLRRQIAVPDEEARQECIILRGKVACL